MWLKHDSHVETSVSRFFKGANHIAITALHSHMTSEEPRLFFMHFWAVDEAATLARGLRAALDRMAVKHS